MYRTLLHTLLRGCYRFGWFYAVTLPGYVTLPLPRTRFPVLRHIPLPHTLLPVPVAVRAHLVCYTVRCGYTGLVTPRLLHMYRTAVTRIYYRIFAVHAFYLRLPRLPHTRLHYVRLHFAFTRFYGWVMPRLPVLILPLVLGCSFTRLRCCVWLHAAFGSLRLLRLVAGSVWLHAFVVTVAAHTPVRVYARTVGCGCGCTHLVCSLPV